MEGTLSFSVSITGSSWDPSKFYWKYNVLGRPEGNEKTPSNKSLVNTRECTVDPPDVCGRKNLKKRKGVCESHRT